MMIELFSDPAHCLHRQAQEITLTIGEIISCQCIDCHAMFPADWIAAQRQFAEMQAYCQHAEIIEFDLRKRQRQCFDCGAWL